VVRLRHSLLAMRMFLLSTLVSWDSSLVAAREPGPWMVG
jgi:hypothetical protein